MATVEGLKRICGQGWTAVRGARRYASAIVRGDFVDEAAAQERAHHCRACNAATCNRAAGTRIVAVTCGRELVDRSDAPIEPTCGCLVLWIENRDMLAAGTTPAEAVASARPAGKLLVAGERCPRGLWSEEQPCGT